jgi:hypothetical protein
MFPDGGIWSCEPTQNTVAKKRARWEATDSDYLFGNHPARKYRATNLLLDL